MVWDFGAGHSLTSGNSCRLLIGKFPFPLCNAQGIGKMKKIGEMAANTSACLYGASWPKSGSQRQKRREHENQLLALTCSHSEAFRRQICCYALPSRAKTYVILYLNARNPSELKQAKQKKHGEIQFFGSFAKFVQRCHILSAYNNQEGVFYTSIIVQFQHIFQTSVSLVTPSPSRFYVLQLDGMQLQVSGQPNRRI